MKSRVVPRRQSMADNAGYDEYNNNTLQVAAILGDFSLFGQLLERVDDLKHTNIIGETIFDTVLKLHDKRFVDALNAKSIRRGVDEKIGVVTRGMKRKIDELQFEVDDLSKQNKTLLVELADVRKTNSVSTRQIGELRDSLVIERIRVNDLKDINAVLISKQKDMVQTIQTLMRASKK